MPEPQVEYFDTIVALIKLKSKHPGGIKPLIFLVKKNFDMAHVDTSPKLSKGLVYPFEVVYEQDQKDQHQYQVKQGQSN